MHFSLKTEYRPRLDLCIKKEAGSALTLPDRHTITTLTQQCVTPKISDYIAGALDTVYLDPNSTFFIAKKRNSDDLAGYTSTILTEKQHRLKGTPYYDALINYFIMGMVSEQARGQGVYQVLNYHRILHAIQSPSDLIFVRTQNPVVFLGLSRMLAFFVKQGTITSYQPVFSAIE